MAPEIIPGLPSPKTIQKLWQFEVQTINIDSSEGSKITFLDYDENQNKLLEDLSGNLIKHDIMEKSSVLWFTEAAGLNWKTTIKMKILSRCTAIMQIKLT